MLAFSSAGWGATGWARAIHTHTCIIDKSRPSGGVVYFIHEDGAGDGDLGVFVLYVLITGVGHEGEGESAARTASDGCVVEDGRQEGRRGGCRAEQEGTDGRADSRRRVRGRGCRCDLIWSDPIRSPSRVFIGRGRRRQAGEETR